MTLQEVNPAKLRAFVILIFIAPLLAENRNLIRYGKRILVR